jgi:general secretion pathway protein G
MISVSPSSPRAGFSLLEILVVILIISILATVVGVNVAKEPGRARAAKAQATIASLGTALQLYRMDNGQLPTMEQGLDALCTPPDRPPAPQRYREGGYLDSPRVPSDPWAHPYVYLMPGPEGRPFDIISYGSDADAGGAGEAADVRHSELE